MSQTIPQIDIKKLSTLKKEGKKMNYQLNVITPQTPVQTVYEFYGLLNAAEVAEILNISKSKVYRLMQTGEIPTVCIGTAKRIRPENLHNYINNNLRHTNS